MVPGPVHGGRAHLRKQRQKDRRLGAVSGRLPEDEFADHTEITDVGIAIHPPSINISQASFTVAWESKVNTNGHIQFGLGAIKGVSEITMSIIEEREQVDRSPACTISATDFADGQQGDAGPHKSGAWTNCARSSNDHRCSPRLTKRSIGQAAADKANEQNTMFGMFEDNETDEAVLVNLHVVPAWGQTETLSRERTPSDSMSLNTRWTR